jgi:serralysin
MSGTGTTTSVVNATGDQYIDGILVGDKWADSIIYYSFSTSSAAYNYADASVTDLPAHFRVFTLEQETATKFALDGTGNAAAAGFSIAGFTLANIQGRGEVNSTSETQIRFGGTTSSELGTSRVADFPGSVITSDPDDDGDVWIGNSSDDTIYDTRYPVAGGYAWYTHLHEIGHAMGLKHPHDTGGSGVVVPLDEDTMEFSVMSYKSYYNADMVSLHNEEWGDAQTYMMLDIAALQSIYGADYTSNSGNTVYKWTPDSGNTVIDGAVAIEPGANRIFATLWDGGGSDTYDLSAYSSALSIDLRPGKWSVFDSDQLAGLGDGHFARGSIFNALEYQNNKASLIENAIGGSGDDTLVGNDADNVLTGGLGADALSGGAGSDTASYATAAAAVVVNLARPGGNTGDAAGDTYDSIENLQGSGFADTLTGDSHANNIKGGAAADVLNGGGGDDTLVGNSGSDSLSGGAGVDDLYGGTGADKFMFNDNQTGATKSTADTIFDFSRKQHDSINVHAIDANSKVRGDQNFTFIGSSSFDHHAGELRIIKTATDTYVVGDVNGDGKQDFVIDLHDVIKLSVDYFVL